MNPRTVPPLRLDAEETISGSLQEALDTAVQDELPDEARMIRMEGAMLAAIASPGEASTNEELASSHVRPSHAPTTEWRSPTRARVRLVSAKIGLAALVGMGAAWSSVTGYRAYQAAVERASNEPSPAATQRSTAMRARAIAPATKNEIADEGAKITTPQSASLSNDPRRAAAPTSVPAQGLVLPAPSTSVVATVEEPSIAGRLNPSPKIAAIEPAR